MPITQMPNSIILFSAKLFYTKEKRHYIKKMPSIFKNIFIFKSILNKSLIFAAHNSQLQTLVSNQ